MLALLLARRGGVISVDQFIDELWPEGLTADPRMLVHGYVSRLRRALGAPGARIITRKPGYLLQVEQDEWDVYLFEKYVADARAARAAGQLERSVELFARAHAQWGGQPFADIAPTPTIAAATAVVTELRLSALEDWFDARLARGSDPELAADVTREVAAHPLREQLVGQLMRALERSGRRAEALAAFRQTRERLIDELGVEPGPDLQRLHQQVLGADQASNTEPTPSVPAQLPMGVVHFVGRQAELATLDKIAIVATITGTAGVGKSSLAVHWAHQVHQRFPDGQLFVNLRGFDPQSAAVDPGEVLLGFLEALGVPADRMPSTTDARSALFRTVLTNKRVLILLDNARDVEQARTLLPGTRGSLVLITSRNELSGLVAMDGAQPITLDVLNDVEAVQLMTARLGSQRLVAAPDAVQRIVKRCAGLPLALAVVAASSAVRPGSSLEAIASHLDTGSLDAFHSGDPKSDLRSVFSWSYRTLSPPAARMFRLLGTFPGMDITLAAAASLAGATIAETRRLLEELNRAQLIAEHRPGRFASHDLLKIYATELADTMESSERADACDRLLNHYLHTSYAAALILEPKRQPITLGDAPANVSTASLSDYVAAMAWFDAEHQILLGMVEGAEADPRGWKLAWSMSTFLRRRSYGTDFIRTQQAALRGAQRFNDLAGRANSAFSLAMAQLLYGDPAAAYEALQLAVDNFRPLGDHFGLASAYHLQVMRYEGEGDYATAFWYARDSLEQYKLANHVAGQGRALGGMGWLQARLGNFKQALEYCRSAQTLAQESEDVMGDAEITDSISHIHLQCGELDEALEGYLRASGLFRRLGDVTSLVRSLIGLGDTHHARGDNELSSGVWREALAMAIEANHPDTEKLRTRLADPTTATVIPVSP